MDQTTVITNSFRGMKGERSRGTSTKKKRREGRRKKEKVGRTKIAGKKELWKKKHDEGRIKEHRMKIREEETE